MDYVFRLEKAVLEKRREGTVVQWGTGEPCLNAALKILKIKGGTVVLLGTGAPCYISGRAELGFLGLCFFFLVFVFWLLGCIWV